MSARAPSGTYTRPAPARAPVVVPTQKTSDRAAFCGCCCFMHRRGLLILLAFGYLAILALSIISVGAGVDNHMTTFKGQVKVDATKYKITEVPGSALKLWTGWLKYNDGSSNANPKDLASLSTASGVLGFVVALFLICSIIVAASKFIQVSCCSSQSVEQTSVCPSITLSVLLLALFISFYAVTSRDLNNFAHKSLGVLSQNDVAMVPGYAWYCGFFAAVLWFVTAIFALGLPNEPTQEYHQF